jgi:hypothetical protein
MAKASFHKNQRVYVKPVGTWAIVERVLPQWVKGLEEPLKVHYDVGLGREFGASELVAEKAEAAALEEGHAGRWRIMRLRNRWRDGHDAVDHPQPGTYPVVMTDEHNWGGWRVPIAEYDRDPEKIEFQSRMIEATPALMQLAKALVKMAGDNHDELPVDVIELAKETNAVLRRIHEPGRSEPALLAAE